MGQVYRISHIIFLLSQSRYYSIHQTLSSLPHSIISTMFTSTTQAAAIPCLCYHHRLKTSLPVPTFPLTVYSQYISKKDFVKIYSNHVTPLSHLPDGFPCHSELIFNIHKNIRMKNKVKTCTHSKAGHNLLPHSSEKL